MNGRAAARSGEWAQHFSNASCFDQSNKSYYRSRVKKNSFCKVEVEFIKGLR